MGSAVQHGISKGRVGHGRLPRRAAKFGKGVVVAGRERLSSERASCRRELPEVDERSRAAGPSVVGGSIASARAWGHRRRGRGFAQECGPLTGPKQLDAPIELGWRDARLAGRPVKQHAGRKGKQLPASHFVIGARGVGCELEASTAGVRQGCFALSLQQSLEMLRSLVFFHTPFSSPVSAAR